MLIGVPTEIKQDEHRVGLTPTSVRELTFHGHKVLVQGKAGAGIGVRDLDYERAGATIVGSASEVYGKRRDDREGQGAAAGRVCRCSVTARCSSPTCTWRRIPSRPRAWSSLAWWPSATRPSRVPTTACPCCRP